MKRNVFVIIVSLCILLIFAIVYQVHLFNKSAGTPITQVIHQILYGLTAGTITAAQKDAVVFLVLGTNEIPNRNIPPLTDTMMAASVNVKTGRVGLFSIPRDIWSDAYKTKIDALYTYGLDRFPGHPEKFPEEVLTDLLEISFDRTVIVTPDAFVAFIDTIGGIDINVTRPFTDTQYPRSDVNIFTETDPNKLYETVTFKAGLQHMDGERALTYIRSRHAEGSEGSDIARSRRQREIVSVIAAKFKHPLFYTDAGRLGKLYALYSRYISSSLNISDVVALAKKLYPIRSNMSVVEGTTSIYPDNPDGSIYHPDTSPLNDGQWVFLIKNQTQLQKEVHETLGL